MTATTGATGTPPSAAVRIAMTLDCAALSGRAARYAHAHGYCDGRAGRDIAGPDNTVPGNCGESWLYMGDAGYQEATFTYGFQSTLGNVLYRSLAISYQNLDTGYTGGFPDSGGMNSGYFADGPAYKYTEDGDVFGKMTGWVLLWWGGVCTLNIPTSAVEVT